MLAPNTNRLQRGGIMPDQGTQELAGKVALITGAAKNIGRSIALELAAAGASIAVNTRASLDDGEHVVHEIRSGGAQAELYAADIGDASPCKTMVANILNRFGRIDILVL